MITLYNRKYIEFIREQMLAGAQGLPPWDPARSVIAEIEEAREVDRQLHAIAEGICPFCDARLHYSSRAGGSYLPPTGPERPKDFCSNCGAVAIPEP